MIERFARWCYDRAPLMLILATLLWAGNAIAARFAVGRIGPMSLVTARWLLVCALLSVFLRDEMSLYRDLLWAHRRRIVLMACFGFTGFNVLLYNAGYYTSGVNITLLQSTIPLSVFAGALAFRGLRPSPQQIAGMILTLIGVVLVATQGAPAKILALRLNFGDGLTILGCVFYAGYTLALRDRPSMPALVFFAALALAALATSIPFILAEVATGRFYWPTAGGWALATYVGLGPSFLAQLLYMRGIELIGPSRAGLYNNLVPIFGALLAVALLGEAFYPYHAVALALTLAGVWLAEVRPR